MEQGIIWVHPTDVINAASFAEQGEILLTCSTNFPLESMQNANDISLLKRDLRKLGLPADVDDVQHAYETLWLEYMSTLAHAGVIAIGFGLKMKHPTIPKAMLQAAMEYHIMLFEVPEEVNFSEIVKTVLHRQAEESEGIQRVMYSVQRELFRATDSENVIESVVRESARRAHGWSAFVNPKGGIVSISDASKSQQAMHLSLLMIQQEEQHSNSAKTCFCISKGRNRYYLCIVEDGRQRLGTVIVSSQGNSDSSIARAVGISAADALAWSLPSRIEERKRRMRIGNLAVEQLAGGNVDLASLLFHELHKNAVSFPMTLLCIDPQSTQSDFTSSVSDDIADDGALFGKFHDYYWILVPVDQSERIRALLANSKRILYGTAAIKAFSEAPDAFQLALKDLCMKRIGSHDSIIDLSPHELVSPEIAAAYSSELFALVRSLPTNEKNQLMRTLRELLYTAFNVGAAAKRLAVHRHTVENRMSKLESLLGLDFANESARVKVWIACSFMRDEEMSTSR
ncbi:helix-turn-helix domain-containing protein [Bifidobacterium aquikefiricola]|uniref:Helix-turn-helix domain-containing protein n=1 Tax=Bifidobacterium aquikefiricola TaxID=3059038 RepID=A0AB39U565_9BIFI